MPCPRKSPPNTAQQHLGLGSKLLFFQVDSLGDPADCSHTLPGFRCSQHFPVSNQGLKACLLDSELTFGCWYSNWLPQTKMSRICDEPLCQRPKDSSPQVESSISTRHYPCCKNLMRIQNVTHIHQHAKTSFNQRFGMANSALNPNFSCCIAPQ